MKLATLFFAFLIASYSLVCKPSSFVTRPSLEGIKTQLNLDQALTSAALTSLQARCLLPLLAER